jgi:hypothetical protein
MKTLSTSQVGTIIPLGHRIALRELIFAFLTTRPQFLKPAACRKSLVGPMRTLLTDKGSALTGVWPHAPARALALIEARGEADRMLADFCARCGRCEWGFKPGPTDTDRGANRAP